MGGDKDYQRSRRGPPRLTLSTAVRVLVVILAALGGALADTTDGRSWGVLALIGVLAIVYGVVTVRRARGSGFEEAVARPFRGVAAIAAGLGFAVVGVLVAAGVLDVR